MIDKIITRFSPKNSFKKRLIITTLIIAVLLSTVFSIISINSYEKSEIQTNKEILGTYANHTAEQIFESIMTATDIFETISKNIDLFRFTEQIYKNDTLREIFQSQTEENKKRGNFYINHTSKLELYDKILHYFNDIINSVEEIAMIRIFAPDGNIIVGSIFGNENTLDYRADKVWFKHAIDLNSTLKINQTGISPISLARRQNNQPAIRFYKAISTNESERQGILIMNINAIRITNSVEQLKIRETGFGMMLDLNYENAEGEILGEIYLAHGYDHNLIFNEKTAGNILFKRSIFMNSGELMTYGFISYNWNDVNWESSFSKVRIEGREMYVLSSITSKEYYQRINNYILNLSISLIFILMVLLGLISNITAHSLKSLEKLIEATTVISEGSYQHQLKIGSDDEFGRLGINFNKMVVSIKKNIDKLQGSERRYRMLFMLFPHATVVLHGDIISLSNPVFDDLFGYKANLNKFNMLIYNEERIMIHDLIRKMENIKLTLLNENLIGIHYNGNRFPLEIILSKIEFLGDLRYIIFFEDISDRLRLEEEKLQKIKIESLSLLAGGIAHDFNNMLMLILGNANIIHSELKNKISHETHLKLLDEIERTVKYATKLTNQFLTFSKGGEPVIKSEWIDELINDTVSLIMRGSSSSYEIDIEKNLPPVDIDHTQITQVINNITINAIQSMPNGGKVKISVCLKNPEDMINMKTKDYIMISISDTGSGIPNEIKDKIFNPYFTTKNKGTGLGLATSYSIINKHEGHLSYSTSPSGTTFEIYLPISSAQPKNTSKPQVYLEKFSGKILLMDDDKDVQSTVSYMLQKLGFEVTIANNGEECIEYYEKSVIENNKFDLVILDLIIVGGMGGKKTIYKLLEINHDIIAIVSSGYSNDRVMANYKEYGFKGILPKPFTFSTLKELIINIIL